MPMGSRRNLAMIDATRLTRGGRLDEAMAVLRRACAGVPSPEPAANARPTPAGGSSSSLLDMTPPSAETGDAWTAQAPREPQASESGLAGLLERAG